MWIKNINQNGEKVYMNHITGHIRRKMLMIKNLNPKDLEPKEIKPKYESHFKELTERQARNINRDIEWYMKVNGLSKSDLKQEIKDKKCNLSRSRRDFVMNKF